MISNINDYKNLYVHALTFYTLVELGSFSAVAKKINVNQSTVSRRIAALEEELNLQLIRRNTRNIEITLDGRRFYQFVIEHESILRNGIAKFKNVTSEHGVTLRVSIPMGIANGIISSKLALYAREHPNLTLFISYQNREIDLIKEDFDVVIIRHIPKHQTLKIRKLYTASINIYCTPDYIKRYGLPRTYEELQKHFVVGAINDHGSVDSSTLSVTTPSGEQVAWGQFARIYTNSLEPVLRIARDGHAIIGGTDLLYQSELERGELIKVMPGYKFATAEFYLVRLGNNKNPLVDDFIHFVESCFSDVFIE